MGVFLMLFSGGYLVGMLVMLCIYRDQLDTLRRWRNVAYDWERIANGVISDRDALQSRLDTTLAALGNAIAEREALRREIVQPSGKDGKFVARGSAGWMGSPWTDARAELGGPSCPV